MQNGHLVCLCVWQAGGAILWPDAVVREGEGGDWLGRTWGGFGGWEGSGWMSRFGGFVEEHLSCAVLLDCWTVRDTVASSLCLLFAVN